MKIIKHNSASPDPDVTQDVLFDDGVTVIQGFRINLNGSDYRLADGDYIIIDGSNSRHIPASSIDNLLRQEYKEIVGREALRNIWKALADSNLTNTVKASILQTISPVLVACLAGEVQAAKIIAQATATMADFTNPRKTALINILNEAIDKL